jgi:hypothetical protein
MSEDVVRADTEYSLKGTAAHEMFSMWLSLGTPPELGFKSSTGIPFDEEMLELLRPAVIWVEDYKREHAARIFSEEKVEIGEYLGIQPGVCWGTADIVGLSEEELLIADLKTGYVVVDPDCDQLWLYALGVWHQTGCLYDRLKLVIMQPTDVEEPVKEVTFTRAQILEKTLLYGGVLKAAVAPDAPLVPSEDACRFCPAAGACPALQEETMKLARFEAIGNPLALSLDQMGVILSKADMIEEALKAIRGHVVKLLSTGVDVPGWKLVASKKHRAWKDADTILDDLLLVAPLSGKVLDKLAPRKVASPAQAEKILPKEIVARYCHTPAGDPTLAREDDPRPAFTLEFPEMKEIID